MPSRWLVGMSLSQPTHSELFGVAFIVALTFVACQTWANSIAKPDSVLAADRIDASQAPSGPPMVDRLQSDRRGRVGIDDGKVPGGVTVFDDAYPAVSRLDSDLRDALRSASNDSGITFEVSSGWRSDAYQQQVFQQAVAEYGSEEEAARWAARPGTSIHEAGEAADISNASATDWLSRHGADYGLCQTYANEPWHYELRPDAEDDGCPAMYADAAHDPRMR